MPLTKTKGNMYTWCDFTHSHLRGRCPHSCIYCYVQAMERRFGGGHYSGKLRLALNEFDVKYGDGRTIFIEHCNDLFADAVPSGWISLILSHCNEYPGNTYVFQTKNPAKYENFICQMPPKRILGCTIETTDAWLIKEISTAPPPGDRVVVMRKLSKEGERTFITIEPILKGNPRMLARWIYDACPDFVNIGADSKGTGLKEPSANDVRLLIDDLQTYGIEIRAKHNLERLMK